MIRHVVAWKFKEENKQDNIRLVREKLEELPEIIFDIDEFEVGAAIRGDFDLALVSAFKNMEALDRYLIHPSHHAIKNILDRVVEKRALFDYAID